MKTNRTATSSTQNTSTGEKAGSKKGNTEQENLNANRTANSSETNDDIEPIDPAPVLDEADLEENHLTDEEADNIEWEPGEDEKEK